MNQETQAIQGLSKTIRRLRRGPFGPLEWAIITGLGVAVACFLLTAVIVIKQNRAISDTTKNTNRTAKAFSELVRGSAQRDATLAQNQKNIEAALRELQRLMREHDARQVLIIRESTRSSGGRDTVVVVQPTPKPQPTATVTCNPTPILGNCPRGNRGG